MLEKGTLMIGDKSRGGSMPQKALLIIIMRLRVLTNHIEDVFLHQFTLLVATSPIVSCSTPMI